MTAAQNALQKTYSLRIAKILKNTEQEVFHYRNELNKRINEMQKMASEINLEPIKKTVSIQQLRKRLQTIPQKIIHKPFWMDWEKLNEFANGSMAACFGEEFNIFENRRHPRIPRNRLMLMSRINKVVGNRHELNKPAEIFGEYDLPGQSWFTSKPNSREIALAAWMETALQPCGVLSAHLGTALVHPEIDFYFRNLDGEMSFVDQTPMPGETIQNYGKMTSTVVGADTILQRFDFSLSSKGKVFLQGNTVFGYFHPDAMAAQKGMESTGRDDQLSEVIEPLPVEWLQRRHGNQRASMLSEAKLHGDAELRGTYAIQERDWFFQDHFLHDPVMPGSLGVEAANQLLELYAMKKYGKGNTIPIQMQPVHNSTMKWKYRGQILPTDQQMKVFVQITNETAAMKTNAAIIQANAEVWKDDLKIYEINNMQVQVAW
jgi:3-hydroxymyristoyl/3-hydroxydecanoyl-(acyl carrier protein) dehydratase